MKKKEKKEKEKEVEFSILSRLHRHTMHDINVPLTLSGFRDKGFVTLVVCEKKKKEKKKKRKLNFPFSAVCTAIQGSRVRGHGVRGHDHEDFFLSFFLRSSIGEE